MSAPLIEPNTAYGSDCYTPSANLGAARLPLPFPPLCLMPASSFASMADRNEHARLLFVREAGGRLWLQHTRKAGGTALCRALAQPGNARADAHNNCWGLRGRDEVSSRRLMRQMEAAMEARHDGGGLELLSSERGGFPPFARDGLRDGSLDNWTFVTSVRHPIDHLISHAMYDLDFHLHEKPTNANATAVAAAKSLSGAASTLDVSRLSEAVLGIAKRTRVKRVGARMSAAACSHAHARTGQTDPHCRSSSPTQANGSTPIPYSHGCRYDNYFTRVFASACDKPAGALTDDDLRLALATLSSFGLVFVLEWLPEMLPLLRYRLGMRTTAAAVLNRNTDLRPFRFSARSGYTAATRVAAAAGERGAAGELRRALPTREVAELRRLLAFDLTLYEHTRHVAKRQVTQWMFAEDQGP